MKDGEQSHGEKVSDLIAKGPAGAAGHVDSTSDARTVNNVMRHQYKVLSDAEKVAMARIKDLGLELHNLLSSLGTSRELSVAKTKAEEAVMWGVKHITA